MLRRSRYCSSFGGRPCPASRGSSSICAQCTSPRAQFAQIVRIVRAQTHFYYAFRYGDQDGSVHCGDPWHCGARSSLPMLIHIPDHFIAPSVSPVSWCPQHSPRPLCVLSDPVGHARTSPLFSPLLTQKTPFYVQRRTPHRVAQTLIVGPMTIQTMKGWNSFPC